MNKTHAKAINGHVFAEVAHNLDLDLKTDECIVLDPTQIKQIDAVKSLTFNREGQTLTINQIPVPIQPRNKVAFVDDQKLRSLKPDLKKPFSLCLDATLLSDLQRAMSESPRQKLVTITIDLSKPDMLGPFQNNSRHKRRRVNAMQDARRPQKSK